MYLNAIGIDLRFKGPTGFGGQHVRKVSRSCAVAGGLLGL